MMKPSRAEPSELEVTHTDVYDVDVLVLFYQVAKYLRVSPDSYQINRIYSESRRRGWP
jgi:hypothetical protein